MKFSQRQRRYRLSHVDWLMWSADTPNVLGKLHNWKQAEQEYGETLGQIADVKRISKSELLDYVVEHPHYLIEAELQHSCGRYQATVQRPRRPNETSQTRAIRGADRSSLVRSIPYARFTSHTAFG